MPVVQESVKFDRTIGELRQNLVYIYPCVFDDGFFRLRNGWCQDDMLRNGRVKAAELRDQQRSLGNHPGGDFSKTLIMVGVKLLEYLDEASRAGVVNAPALGSHSTSSTPPSVSSASITLPLSASITTSLP